jgi:ubiquinone/menaquinone biosynthesis C-methylase UbiE
MEREMSIKKIYHQHVFPMLLHQAMRFPSLVPHRQDLLRQAKGRVLEIGFGTGANLPYYTADVKEMTTLDSNPGMQKLWRAEAARLGRDVRCFLGRAEKMPFETGVFDTVVSTLTLCSVDDAPSVLTEVWRVLKPHGALLFLEHGLSPDAEVVKWQKRLEPFNKIVADGCHLTRPVEILIRDSGFLIDEIERFYLLPSPRTHTWFVKGTAIRP